MLDAKHDGVLSTTGVLDEESDGVSVMNAVVDIGKARILDDVSVSAPKGSCLVILGPSGCGKSTTLRLIAGLDKITNGRVIINNIDVTNVSPVDRKVGMVFPLPVGLPLSIIFWLIATFLITYFWPVQELGFIS